jgi:hypothetical protein
VKTGNGHDQIREGQNRFAEVQERYLQQVEEQAEEVKRELQQANELGRQAVGQYVNAMASGYQAFVPPAVIDPRQTIDFAADLVVQTAELQRSFLNELLSLGQGNSSPAAAAAAANRTSDGG